MIALKTFQAFVEKLAAASNARNVKTALTLRNSKDAAMMPIDRFGFKALLRETTARKDDHAVAAPDFRPSGGTRLSRGAAKLLAAFQWQAVRPQGIAREAPRAGSVVGIVTMKGRTLSPLAARFLDYVRLVAKPLK